MTLPALSLSRSLVLQGHPRAPRGSCYYEPVLKQNRRSEAPLNGAGPPARRLLPTEGCAPPHAHPQSGVTDQPARAENASDAPGPCSGAGAPHILWGWSHTMKGRPCCRSKPSAPPHFRGGPSPGSGRPEVRA